MNDSPEPYRFAEGAIPLRRCDVPDGWEWRWSNHTDTWLAHNDGYKEHVARSFVICARPAPDTRRC